VNSVSFVHVRELQHDVSELGVVEKDGGFLLELVEARSCCFCSVDWLKLSSKAFGESIPSSSLRLGFNFLVRCSPPHGSMVFQKCSRKGNTVIGRDREKLAVSIHLEDPGFKGVTTFACIR